MGNNQEEIRRRIGEIDEAMRRIRVGGQSVTLGDRQVTRVTYSRLKEERDDLEAQLADAGAEGLMPNVSAAVFDRR